MVQKMAVVASPPRASGSTMRHRIPSVVHPSTRADSSISIGTSSKKERINHTTNDRFASV